MNLKDWKSDFSEKITSKEDAISVVESGNKVVFGHAAGEPTTLVDELVRQKDRLQNVEIIHMVPLGESKYCLPEMKQHFHHNSLFAGAGTRQAIKEGRADYTPVFFSEIPRLFREEIIPIDIAFIQVSPPDEDGYMSFGVSVDYTMQASKSAKIVVAEVNNQMPRTIGAYIHVSDIDRIIETDRSLKEINPPKITSIEEKIGSYIASLVPNRGNLQLGIGGIPDAALKFLIEKRDLGIHTEMFSDGVVDLFEQGVITNKYNNLNPGKFTATFLMGTKKLYKFVDNNPNVEMYPVDYTNNVMIAGKVNNLISINSALQVDLFGQVSADMLGYQQYSGVGGQVDFVRASSLSPGGKSIIAFPSTNKEKTISRIVPRLKEGSCVTTSRNDVHYVITEYGIVNLRGKTIRQRAKALINIAHPDFRDRLIKDFNNLFI